MFFKIEVDKNFFSAKIAIIEIYQILAFFTETADFMAIFVERSRGKYLKILKGACIKKNSTSQGMYRRIYKYKKDTNFL